MAKTKKDESMYGIFNGGGKATPGAGRGKPIQNDGMGQMLGQMNQQQTGMFDRANEAGLLGGIRQSPRNQREGLDYLRSDQEQLQRIVDSHANTAGRKIIQQNPQLAQQRAMQMLGMEQPNGGQQQAAAPGVAPADSGFRFFEQEAPVQGSEPINVGQTPFAQQGATQPVPQTVAPETKSVFERGILPFLPGQAPQTASQQGPTGAAGAQAGGNVGTGRNKTPLMTDQTSPNWNQPSPGVNQQAATDVLGGLTGNLERGMDLFKFLGRNNPLDIFGEGTATEWSVVNPGLAGDALGGLAGNVNLGMDIFKLLGRNNPMDLFNQK